MFITKMHVPRRTVLRGLGATIALPLLDSMIPALTALAQTAAAPVRRLGVFYVPNGMAMWSWFPKTEGPIEQLPPTLKSLQALKANVLLIGGLGDEAANKVPRSGDHARSAGTFLTCVPFKAITDANVIAETTMDQIAAKQFAKQTQLASLELGIESAAMLGTCDGTSCALTNTISWSTPTTPLPLDNDPRSLFERLFGASGSTEPAARLARIKRDRSILDVVNEQLQRLNTRLGPADRLKFGEYLESIRDVERRIQRAEEQNSRELPVVDQPMGIPTDYQEHARLMLDLLALAYQTDLTRVSTFMLAREVSGRAYPEIGVSGGHHSVSHHQLDPEKYAQGTKINQLHISLWTKLVANLAKTADGDGTLLDHTILMHGAGLSDADQHSHRDLPAVTVGGRGLGLKGGRTVKAPFDTPMANFLLGLINYAGVNCNKVGDSTGPLVGL